jgi:hypothetical protein
VVPHEHLQMFELQIQNFALNFKNCWVQRSNLSVLETSSDKHIKKKEKAIFLAVASAVFCFASDNHLKGDGQ